MKLAPNPTRKFWHADEIKDEVRFAVERQLGLEEQIKVMQRRIAQLQTEIGIAMHGLGNRFSPIKKGYVIKDEWCRMEDRGRLGGCPLPMPKSVLIVDKVAWDPNCELFKLECSLAGMTNEGVERKPNRRVVVHWVDLRGNYNDPNWPDTSRTGPLEVVGTVETPE